MLVNAVALSGSNLWRIVVSFALQLLIARALGVQALGAYTVALAYLNVSQVLSEMGLPALLVRDLAAAPRLRRVYFRRSLGIQLAASLLTWAGLAALALLLPYAEPTRTAIWLIGASLPFYAVTSACQTLFRAAERMELLMAVEGAVNLLILVLSLTALLLGASVIPLIGVLVMTQAISALGCAVIVARGSLLAPPQDAAPVSLAELQRSAAPFFGLSVVDVLLQRADILLLSVVGGETATGLYSAAYNLVRVLVKLVQSFWQAVYPTLSRLHSQADAKFERFSGFGLRYGLMFLLPAAALCTAVAGEVIAFIYATRYAEAASPLRALVWIAPVFHVEMYAVTLLMIRQRPQQGLAVMGLNLGVLVLLLPPLAWFAGAVGTAWAVLLAGGIGAAAGIGVLHRLGIRMAFAQLGVLMPAALAAGAAWATAVLFPTGWMLRLVAGAAVYLALLWFTGAFSSADLARFRQAVRGKAE